MFGFDDARNDHQQVYGDGGYENQAKFSHELIAGAAAFEGMKQWEDHQRNEGKPVSHKFAKELLAGFVGGEVDKLAETKGMDFVDKERAQHRAKKGAEQMYDDHYGRDDEYNPQQRDAPNFNYGGGQGGGYGGRQGGDGGDQGGYGESREERREERRERREERREEGYGGGYGGQDRY